MTILRCTRCHYRGPARSFVTGTVYGDPARCPFCRASAKPVTPMTMAGADPAPAAPAASPAPQPASAPSSQPAPGASFVPAFETATLLGPSTDDVQNGKSRLSPYVAQMDVAMAACSAKIPAAMQSAWVVWVSNWKDFYAQPTSILKASSDMARLQQLRDDLLSFETQLLRLCPEAGIVPLSPTSAQPSGIATAIGNLSSTAKVGIVVGGALAGWIIYRSFILGEKVLPELTKVVPFL